MRVTENIKYVKTTTSSQKQNLVGEPYLIPLRDCEIVFETLHKYENRYDTVIINGKVLHRNAINALKRIHQLKEIQNSVTLENEWFEKLASINLPQNCPPLDKNSIKRFTELLLNHIDGKTIKSLNNPRILTAGLVLLARSNWLNLEMIEHYATLINFLRPKSSIMTLQYIREYESRGQLNQLIQQWYQSKIEYICIIVNLGKRKNGSTFVAYDHIKGNNWACFTLDIFEKAFFYGDSLRWPFPKNDYSNQ